MDLVPLKVKIGLNPLTGRQLYPNFNLLSNNARQGMDWANFVDTYGDGWHYDKCCGHKVDTVDSPIGEQWGALLVPKTFADEALIRFPNECAKLSEVDFQTFYESHVRAHQPDEWVDADVLEGIKLKRDLGMALTADQEAALDPNSPMRGIRKNDEKKWADYKVKRGITIVQ